MSLPSNGANYATALELREEREERRANERTLKQQMYELQHDVFKAGRERDTLYVLCKTLESGKGDLSLAVFEASAEVKKHTETLERHGRILEFLAAHFGMAV